MGKFVSQILGSADVQWKLIFEQADSATARRRW